MLRTVYDKEQSLRKTKAAMDAAAKIYDRGSAARSIKFDTGAEPDAF